MSKTNIERREFLQFLAGGIALIGSGQSIARGIMQSFSIPSISPSFADDVILADGLNYQILLSWKDKISNIDTFGYNNDYTAFVPLDRNRGLLWVNHEYPNPLFLHKNEKLKNKTKKQRGKVLARAGCSRSEVLLQQKRCLRCNRPDVFC